MKSNSLIYLLITLVVVLSGCTRSTGFRKESGVYSQSPSEQRRIESAVQKFSPLRKRVVVLPFWNDTPIKGRFEVYSKNVLREILLEQNRLNIVDERDVALRSQDFYLDSEKINVPHVSENGKKWGVSLVILGRISKIVFRRKDDDVGLLRPSAAKASVTLELRLVDVEQAKEVAMGEATGLSESSSLNLFGVDREDNEEYRNDVVTMAIHDAVSKAMPSLNKEIDRIQWRGKIAKITGAKIYINAGRATGLNVGDILKVNSQGQDIFDPETGLFLGRTAGDLKGTIEISQYFGEDGSIGRLHSGGNFLEGDIVQLY
ncbi:MAG: CsgG/HfaB family protein [Oligoflexia bacterium]|nr:CsgG/HfaB family protein [Oligoflexia bacterium]